MSSVCFMTSAVNQSSPRSTTVRHTPLTAIESPCAASETALGARTVRRTPSPDGATAVTAPISSTIPVNISSSPVRSGARRSAGRRRGSARTRRSSRRCCGDRVDAEVGAARAGRCRRRRSRAGSERRRRAPHRRGPSRRNALATVGPPSTKTRCTPRSRSSVSTAARSLPDRCRSGRGWRRRAASSGTGRSPSTTGSGWSSYSVPSASAGGEGRVVGEHGAGADDDRVGRRAATVHVGARLGAGDPLARAVGCRGAPVEALGPLDGDVRAAEALDGQPRVEQLGGRDFEQAGLHLDAGLAQALRAAAWTRDSGRARRRSPGRRPLSISASEHGPVRPVWLQGSSVTTAVAPRAAPWASCESASTSACTVPAPRCQPSARISPAGERMTAPTCGFTPRGPLRASASARRMASRSAAFTDIRILLSGSGKRRTAARSRRSCCLPSGLAAVSCCITVGPGIPPDQPRRHPNRMPVPQLADCHRRFGFTPTPEHVMHLSVVNAPAADSFHVAE